MMPILVEAASAIQTFEDKDLGERIGVIESLLQGADSAKLLATFPVFGIDNRLLEAALVLKATAGQVNVLIHALGILLAAPAILRDGEKVLSLSLGAGNTGKAFDLETTQRVAEFKFIHWKGGSEAIRQNSLFKDFYLLAEYETRKAKELFVIGKDLPLKFLQGRRSLASVMSRNNKLWADFQERYGQRFSVVSDYYLFRKEEVHILDLLPFLPSLGKVPTLDQEPESL